MWSKELTWEGIYANSKSVLISDLNDNSQYTLRNMALHSGDIINEHIISEEGSWMSPVLLKGQLIMLDSRYGKVINLNSQTLQPQFIYDFKASAYGRCFVDDSKIMLHSKKEKDFFVYVLNPENMQKTLSKKWPISGELLKPRLRTKPIEFEDFNLYYQLENKSTVAFNKHNAEAKVLFQTDQAVFEWFNYKDRVCLVSANGNWNIYSVKQE
ncbi:MAG: hypothetical protein HRU15_07320 [Planctomycetes bacterium]|nr:hypothetical protein [Planctomycetota bacterium]